VPSRNDQFSMPSSEPTADSQPTTSPIGPGSERSAGSSERGRQGRLDPPSRFRLTAASAPILLATAVLFALSLIFEPNSVRHSALLGMFPFAAVLAIAAMGQTLVIQQGGIDLSVPGMISLTIVLLTSYPNGNSGKLAAAILLALGACIAAGTITGVVVSVIGVTPIVATLGMNALLYGAVIQISGGNPPPTTNALSTFASGKALGVPVTVIIAVVLTAIVALVIKRTVIGRRFEAVGSGLLGARAAGLRARRHQLATYVVAAVLYCIAGVLLAGIVSSPSAFQGDSYLLPSVAAVVLGGTSLLGGRGSVIATVVAALFITQLDQFILVMGATQGVQNLVDAGALAAGLAIYSVPWKRLRRNGRPTPDRASPAERGAESGPEGPTQTQRPARAGTA
jgi:ribose transport system permease protein